MQTKIHVRVNGKIVDTTTGRVLLYEMVPREVPFDLVITSYSIHYTKLYDMPPRSDNLCQYPGVRT